MPPPALSHPDCDQTYLHHRAARVGGGEGGRERQREGEGGREEGGWEGGGGKKGRREREGGQRCSVSVVARAIVKVNQGVDVGASHALARLAVPTGCPLKVESHQKRK